MITFKCYTCNKEVTALNKLSRPRIDVKIPLYNNLGINNNNKIINIKFNGSVCKTCMEKITKPDGIKLDHLENILAIILGLDNKTITINTEIISNG